jgi:uncharacterized protein
MTIIYTAPDVYVEEVPSGARPIQAVGTRIAGFVGKAPKTTALQNEAVPITNWSEFVKRYVEEGSKSTPLSYAVYGFFENGGSMCYVCNVGDGPVSTGLDALGKIDDIAIVAAPGMISAEAYDALLSHCENLEDRVAVLDGPEFVEDVTQLTKVATQPATSPSTPPRRGAGASASDEGDEGSSPTPARPQEQGYRPRNSDRGFGAVYYPWITVRDPLQRDQVVSIAPSGHVAGIWTRTDATRGVHKAPANEIVRGALAVSHSLSRDEHGILNSAGINAIRFYSGEGVRLMGARTVAPASSEYRYLNLRRLFTMVEESIRKNTRWVIFEPNDEPLWQRIRRDVIAFLMRVWRAGALMGQVPEHAFFVKCDAETNPQENIDAGIVTILIGMAPTKPAEFVVFRVSHYDVRSEIEQV